MDEARWDRAREYLALYLGDGPDPDITRAPWAMVQHVLGLYVPDICGDEVIDNLPGPATLIRTAMLLDEDATLSGCLIEPPRRDARLHLDTVTVDGSIPLETVRQVVQEETGTIPDSIEKVDGKWVIWWD
jgi:hypothetical protein